MMEYIAKTLNIPDLFVSKPNGAAQSASSSNDEMDSRPRDNSLFGNALETMDRFLENESNLIVQSLVSLETKTNISRRYLARGFLIILTGYFVFSNSVLDLVTHLLMFLYPSYRSYMLLKNPDLTKEDLIDILKYWIFIGVFSTFDFVLSFIPFGSVLKLILVIQCVLPSKSPAVEFSITHFVTPIFRYLEKNENIQQVNDYVSSTLTNLKVAHHHKD